MVTPLDLILLPYVDYCFYALALLGTPFRGIPWCGISMRLSIDRTGSAASASMPWKWRMARRILGDSNLKALFVINPSVKDVPQSWYTPKLRSRLRYLPDPAEHAGGSSRHESRIAFGIADTTVTILVFGSIDERKGIDALMGSLATERDLDDYTVILAGKQSESMRAQMYAPVYAQLRSQNRLIVIDRFVSDMEQGDLFAAADVVWVGYRNHIYMSGVLVLAGRAAVPVIGTSGGEIGKLIEEHGIGVAARIDRPTEVTRALRTLRGKGIRETMGRRAQLFFAGHTVENFGTSVLNGFDSPNGD
jgi:glycosyltransferase involved in cell wall biosynthesis